MKTVNWIKQNKILISIILIGAAFRFYKIDYQSVWLDEIHTLNEANPELSLSEMYTSLMGSDPHPPLYFILVQLFFKLFGYSTLVLRIFSALLGIAGLYAIYSLGKELMNKKVGLIATALLAVNYFHIYYSQEARMYSMLFFTTTLAFLFLIRFIKKPTLKSALFHGLFAALMIYTHFFALFALFAQYIILLIFIVKPFNTDRKKMFLYSFFSGILTLLLYLPALKLFIVTTKRTSIWIPMPTVDVYTQIFKEFFGQSEIVLFFVLTLLVLFFMKLYNRESKAKLEINPTEEKQVFSFVFLFTWIIITLLIPLISSYVKLPMLISRYFINILPAVIILVAMGIYYIKNNVVQLAVLSIFIVFSFTDIVVVKKYYKTISKSQFREISQFIIDNNTKKQPVVSNLGWYFPYFLNNKQIQTTIITQTLDAHIDEMIQDPAKIKSFWYADAHNSPFKITEENQKFLDEKFEVAENTVLFDAWTRHYIVIGSEDASEVKWNAKDFSATKGDKITFGVDKQVLESGSVSAFGWAILENQDATSSQINIVLLSEDNTRIVKLKNQGTSRTDVTTSFGGKYNLDNSGFDAKISTENLPKGKYQLGIRIIDKSTKKEGYALTGRFIEI